jgi:hypothetical protein
MFKIAHPKGGLFLSHNPKYMDPPEINYEDPSSLMLVVTKGKIKRLYTPFRVQVREDIGRYRTETWVYVEGIADHRKHRILFLISSFWYPYKFFKLQLQKATLSNWGWFRRQIFDM